MNNDEWGENMEEEKKEEAFEDEEMQEWDDYHHE